MHTHTYTPLCLLRRRHRHDHHGHRAVPHHLPQARVIHHVPHGIIAGHPGEPAGRHPAAAPLGEGGWSGRRATFGVWPACVRCCLACVRCLPGLRALPAGAGPSARPSPVCVPGLPYFQGFFFFSIIILELVSVGQQPCRPVLLAAAFLPPPSHPSGRLEALSEEISHHRAADAPPYLPTPSRRTSPPGLSCC